MAQRAYTDPTALYQEYLNRLFESFNKSLSPTARNSVKDLATFRDLFVQQLHTISAYSPVTKTNYLLTQHVTMMSSGLAIDIDVGPAEDDAYKY